MSPDHGIRHRVWLIALGLIALRANAGSAQDSCSRCLDGFRFLPSAIVNDPFATTHFVNATGGGMAYDLRLPVRNLEGDTITNLKGDIGFLLVDFEYQAKIARWLALRATLTGAARVGTNAQAVVASGVTAAFGGSLGATVPVWQTDKFLVALDGTFRRSTEYNIDPFGFVQEVADSGYINDGARATLLGTEQVSLSFTDDAVDAIATLAAEVNDGVENIGARRLQTIMERVLEEMSFDAADRPGTTVTVDAAYVKAHVGELAANADLSRFIL